MTIERQKPVVRPGLCRVVLVAEHLPISDYGERHRDPLRLRVACDCRQRITIAGVAPDYQETDPPVDIADFLQAQTRADAPTSRLKVSASPGAVA